VATQSRALCRAGARLQSCGALIGLALAVTAVLGLAACGDPLHPSKWKDDPDEIPPGEGLLTGEDGAFTIYSDN